MAGLRNCFPSSVALENFSIGFYLISTLPWKGSCDTDLFFLGDLTTLKSKLLLYIPWSLSTNAEIRFFPGKAPSVIADDMGRGDEAEDGNIRVRSPRVAYQQHISLLRIAANDIPNLATDIV